MWRHVKGIFAERGLDASHVQWVWCVNHTDNGDFAAERFYPGDEYVDWVAIDGYNWGETEEWSNWSMPAELYDPMIARLRRLTNKPLAIPEYATTSATTSGASAAAKGEWISAVLRYVQERDVRLIAWFNEDKETDWAVFGGRLGDASFTGDGRYLGPEPPAPSWGAPSPWLLGAGALATGVTAIILLVIRQSRSIRHGRR
jgi:hypothetical protein